MKLRKIENFERKFFHRFQKKDGSTFHVECTKAEYEALALPNAGQPTYKDGVWALSAGEGIYINDNGIEYWGDFPTNTFIVNPNGKLEAKVGEKMIPLTEEDMDILTGDVNENGLAKISK